MATNNINNLPDNREFSMEDLEQISGGYISPDPETQAWLDKCTKAMNGLSGIQKALVGKDFCDTFNKGSYTAYAKDIEKFMQNHGLV